MTRVARLDSWPSVIGVYLLATVIFTWPLAYHATSHLPAGHFDIWQNLWNFWWWREAWLELGTSPHATDLLFHPHGTTLALHTHSTFNQIVAFPVNALFGEIAALNFATALGFALSAIAAHHLAWELTGHRGAAYLAGFVYAFFPHHMEQSLEHLNLSSLQFLPWIALYGIRVVRGRTRRDALLFGLVFALNALSCWHYAVFSLFVLPFAFAIGAGDGEGAIIRIRRSLGSLCIAAAVVGVIMAPFAIGMALQTRAESVYVKPPVERGIDLAFLLVPSDQHPLWGHLTQDFYRDHRRYMALGSQAFLGFVPLVLAGLALRRGARDRAVMCWLGLFATGLLLAVGSNVQVAGHGTGIPGPHALFAKLPLLDNLRVANRFVVLSMLALAMLAAYGVARGLTGRRHAAAIACGLLTLEFLWLPYPIRVGFSPILERLAGEPAGAVLDIPLSDQSPAAPNLAFQTRHGRPIAGGYVSVGPAGNAALERDPVLGMLAGFAPDVPERIDVERLRELGFALVIMHKDRTLGAMARAYRDLGTQASFYARRRYEGAPGMPDAIFEGLSRRFESQLGSPVHEDSRLRVFRLANDSPAPRP